MEQALTVKWKIRETETSRILGLLPQMVEKTRNEKGNISYDIFQSVDDVNVLILQESYADAEALEAHKKSEHYQDIVVKQIVPHLEIREVVFLKKLF